MSVNATPKQENNPDQNQNVDHVKVPEIEWNNALEELLCNEAEKCQGLAWLHSHAEIEYSKQNNRLQIPIIILSTIVGAASVGSSSLFPGNAEAASIGLGGISIVVSILGLLNTHYSFGKRAEGHKLGSVQYAQIHRMIHIEMSLPRSQRMAPKAILRYIKDDLKRLMETLPRIPETIIASYKKEIIPNSIGVSHPEITNGVHKVEAYLEDTVSITPSNPSPAKSPIKISIL
jgi:hypothetical protein